MSTYQTAIPGASGYAQSNLLAKEAWDNAKIRIQHQRGDLLRKYGYQQGADGSMSVDPNSQYGAIQQMYRGQAGEMDNAESHMRQRGMTGGLNAHALNDVRYNEGMQANDLGNSLLGGMNDLADNERDAETNYNNTLYDAELQATRDAINKGNFSPGDYSDLPPEPYPSTAQPPATKAKKANPAKHKIVKQVVAQRKATKAKKGR